MLRGGNTGKGRAWETRQSVACSLGPWKAVRLGLRAADNCLGRGFPVVLSRGAPPTMHWRQPGPGGRGACTPGGGRGRVKRALRRLGELWPRLVLVDGFLAPVLFFDQTCESDPLARRILRILAPGPCSEENLRDSLPGPSSEENLQKSCPWPLFLSES